VLDHTAIKEAFDRTRIVGAAISDYPLTPEWSILDHHVHAIRHALDDAGLQLSDVDGLLTVSGGFGGATNPMGLSEYLGIRPRFVDGTSVGGSTLVYHAARAALAVGSGLCEVAVVVTGELGRSGGGSGRRFRGRGGAGQGFGSFFWDSTAGLPLVGAYAMAAQRHMHDFGTKSEDFAEIAVKTRYHASLNPKAQYQEPITTQDVLDSRWIAEPLHLLDCCVVSDGGGAYVVTTADRAKDLRKKPVRMLGYGERVGHAGIGSMPDYTRTAAADSGKLAFEIAGLKPSDMECAQLYDSFTITVMLQLEDLGFCKKGEGKDFVHEHLKLGGPLPINTDGGGLSACHPGMRGMFLMLEGVRQVRGEELWEAIPPDTWPEEPRRGSTVVRQGGVDACVVHGVGGQLSSHATLILGKDS
jgi:acetyl-CoA acetyltransferase